MSAATTSAVAIVNDDCAPGRRWVEVAEGAFAAIDKPPLLTTRALPLPLLPEGDRVAALAVRGSEQPKTWKRPPMPWHVDTGANSAAHRALILAVDGDDEGLGTGSAAPRGNDLDLFCRFLGANAAACDEPDLVVQNQRATAAEYAQRRGSYGYSVSPMLGVGLRRLDPRAVVVLPAWLWLRVRLDYSRCTSGGLRHEIRVLAGTGQALLRGLRRKANAGRSRG